MDKTVLVVDDHPLFREALVHVVEQIDSRIRVLWAASAEEGLRKAREGELDLILLDLDLPGARGVDAMNLLRKVSEAPVLIVSASTRRQDIEAVTRAGAFSVVSKGVSLETLREVVERALTRAEGDRRWIRPSRPLELHEPAGKPLTRRQQEIATLLMEGHSNKEIFLAMPIKSALALLVLVLYAGTLFELGRDTIDEIPRIVPMLHEQWQPGPEEAR